MLLVREKCLTCAIIRCKMDHIETNRLFETEPYRYAVDLVNIMAPTCDEEGHPEEISSVGRDAFYCLQRDGFDFLFSQSEYYGEDEIQRELINLSIDPESFWNALLMLDYMSEDKFHEAMILSPTDEQSILMLIEALEADGSSLIAKKANGRMIVVKSDNAIRAITRLLRSGIDAGEFDNRLRYFNQRSIRSGSLTERIAYEATILKKFFRLQYEKQHETEVDDYKNPLLLISRLLYLMKLASDEEYWVSSERLKGNLKSYPKPGEKVVARRFWF